ncbi:UNVERIFIED_CONTAM: hypothetical protein GTU68_019346 [Idotea baltica]|nr:hypothetical protein [Idotea baltica]
MPNLKPELAGQVFSSRSKKMPSANMPITGYSDAAPKSDAVTVMRISVTSSLMVLNPPVCAIA